MTSGLPEGVAPDAERAQSFVADSNTEAQAVVKWILLAFCIAPFQGARIANAQGSIAGRVMASETKVPVVGAVVTVHRQERQATTDSSGKFSLRDVKAGTVFLITRAVG